MSVRDIILGRGNSRRSDDSRQGRGNDRRSRYVEREAGPEASHDGYRILRIILMETGTYNPEYFRPYATSLNSSSIDEISDLVDENGPGKLRADDLSGAVGRIMRMRSSVTDDDLVDIEEGWDSPRLAFMIEVAEERHNEFSNRADEEIVTTISGYTNACDLVETPRSDYGDIAPAPDLEFFVTAVHNETRETRRIALSDQIVSPQYYKGYEHLDNRRSLYTLRPRDLMNTETARESTPVGARSAIASNHLSGNMPKASRTSNLLPSHYLASSINAIISGETQREGLLDSYGNHDPDRRVDRKSVFTKAASVLRENSPTAHNSFLYLIKRSSNTYGTRNTFLWEDLEDLFGQEVRRTTKYYKRGTVQRESGARRSLYAEHGESTSWDDESNGGYNAIIATAVKQALPGIALMYGIYACRIDASNINVYESDDDIAGALIDVDNVIFTSKLQTQNEEYYRIDEFKHQVANHILRGASIDNTVPYDLVVELDWRADSFITVGIDGGEMLEFSTASYTNALTSPIITNDRDATMDIVADFQNIVRNILD